MVIADGLTLPVVVIPHNNLEVPDLHVRYHTRVYHGYIYTYVVLAAHTRKKNTQEQSCVLFPFAIMPYYQTQLHF